MDNQQERQEVDLGWLAGAVDGEGCYCLSIANRPKRARTYITPMITICNTDDEFIDNADRILMQNNIPFHISYRKGKGKNKNSRTISIVGLKRTKKFMDVVRPYLASKSDRVKIFCEYLRRRLEEYPPEMKSKYSEKDLDLVNALRKLNGSLPLESPETLRHALPME